MAKVRMSYNRFLPNWQLFYKNYCLFFFFIFWLCGIVVACRLSLVAERGDYSLVVVLGLLIAVAFLVAEHRLHSAGFSGCGAWA